MWIFLMGILLRNKDNNNFEQFFFFFVLYDMKVNFATETNIKINNSKISK